MIEVVVGLGIATLLAVALISTTIYTEKLSRAAKNRTQASKLVQQAVEQLRGFRDSQTGGFSLLAPTGLGCYYDTNNDPTAWTFSGAVTPCGAVSPPCSSPTTAIIPTTPSPGSEQIQPSGSASSDVIFSRWVQFTCITTNQKTFTVFVAWQGSSGVEYVSSASSLSNPCTSAASACPN